MSKMNQTSNRNVNSARNGIFGLLNKLILMVFPFVIRTIMIKTLGTEYLGLSSLFTSILNILSLTELGFGSAMVFYLYKPISENDNPTICAFLNLYRKIYYVIGIIILILGLISMAFLKNLISGTYPSDINIYIIFLIYLFSTVSSYFFFGYRKALLKGYQRSDVISNVSSIVHLVYYIVQIIFLIIFRNYYLFIIWLPLSTIIENVLVYFRSRKLYKDISCFGFIEKDIKSSIFKRTGALFGHKLGAVLIGSFDNIVISAFLGLTTLAIFNNYYYVIIALNGFIDILASAVLYSIGNFIVNKEKEDIYKLFLNLTFINITLVSCSTCCLLSLYQDFMLIWVGTDNVIDSKYIIILFVLYFYTWKSRITGLNFKDAAGMWKNDAVKPYVGIIFDLILDIVLIQYLGIQGVLISTIFVMLFIYFPWETKVLFEDLFVRSSKQYYRKMITYSLSTIFITSLVYYINSFIIVSNIGYLIIKGIFSFSLFIILWSLIYFRTSEFHYSINKFKQVFTKRS